MMVDIPKRSKNFMEEECRILIYLVKKHHETLENKKTDAMSIRVKEEVWKRLADEFNELSGRTARDWKVLKGKYENLKKISKKRFAEDHQYFSATGGRPSKPSSVTLIDWDIRDLIGFQVDGESSEFDSDRLTEDLPEAEENNRMTFIKPVSEVAKITVLPELTMVDHLPSSSKKNGMETETFPDTKCLKNMQDSKFSPLKFKRRRVGINGTVAGRSVAEAASFQKSEIVALQKQIYEEQLKMAREEHDLKMEVLRLEVEEKKLDIKIKQRELEKWN